MLYNPNLNLQLKNVSVCTSVYSDNLGGRFVDTDVLYVSPQTSRFLCGRAESAIDHKPLAPEFNSGLAYSWNVFHLSLHLSSGSTGLFNLPCVYKSSHKTRAAFSDLKTSKLLGELHKTDKSYVGGITEYDQRQSDTGWKYHAVDQIFKHQLSLFVNLCASAYFRMCMFSNKCA